MVALPRFLRLLAAAAGIAAIAAATPVQAQKVGVNSAVNPDATGTPPGGAARKLVLGSEVVHNEHVATGPNGQTQILFLDESAMTVGPNADVTIDEFVYDPNTGNGRLAMSATQGVMRFVGGKLSKKADAVSLTTPVGTLGIRGGVFLLDLSRDCPPDAIQPRARCPLSLEVVFLYGDALSVTAGNVTQLITRPGFSVVIPKAGASPSQPGPPASGRMQKLLGQFAGRAGTSGGSTHPPSDASIANSAIPLDISGNTAVSDQQARAYTQTTLPQPPNVNAVQSQAILNTTANNPSPTQQQQPFPNTTGISGGINVLGTGNPAFGFPNQIQPYSGATVQNGILSATAGSFTASIPLAPGFAELTNQGNSPLGPLSGTTFATTDNSFFFANLFPVSQPNNTIFVYGGTPVSQTAFQPTGTPQVFAFELQPDAVLQSPIPFIRNQTGGSLSNPTVSPLFLAVSPLTGFATGAFSGSAFPKALQASLAIDGQGPGQSAVLSIAVGNIFTTAGNPGQTVPQPVLNGVVEGAFLSGGGTTPILLNSQFLTAIDATGNSFYGKNQISGFVLDANSCCQGNGQFTPTTAQEFNPLNGQRVNYQFNQPAITTALPTIGSGTQSANSLTGFAGGMMNKIVGGVATPYAVLGTAGIQTDPVNLQIAAQIAATDVLTPGTSGVSLLSLSYGSLSPGNTNARQAFINDNLFATMESPGGAGSSLNGTPGTAQIYLVNANAVPNTTLLPNGLCQQCQFMQWGYWGGQVTTGARNDVGAINFWVAGFQTPVAQLPTTGSGSYSGNAIGSVVNNGATYIAAGGFNQTYNFGSQTGTVNITNFDGANYSANVAGHGSPLFAGTLAGPAGRSGAVAGGFFGTGAQAASETGGSFAIQSATPGYLAAGVFAGRLTGPIH